MNFYDFPDMEHGQFATLTKEQFRVAFWDRVEKSDGCWLWKLSVGNYGYGQWTIGHGPGKVTLRPHRIAYELTNGPIPPGLDVCHKCDVRRCCRPDHLFVGTRKDNMLDAARKGRTHRPKTPLTQRLAQVVTDDRPLGRRPRGERVNTSKLTPEIVQDIRRRWRSGEATAVDLAREYGISAVAALKAAKGITWRHVK